MIAWLKSLPLVKAAGVFLAAVFFGLAAGAVARQKDKAKASAQASEKNAAAGAGRALARAAKQAQAAETHKQRAETARTEAEKRLDAIGASNETLADLVGAWNTERLRD